MLYINSQGEIIQDKVEDSKAFKTKKQAEEYMSLYKTKILESYNKGLSILNNKIQHLNDIEKRYLKDNSLKDEMDKTILKVRHIYNKLLYLKKQDKFNCLPDKIKSDELFSNNESESLFRTTYGRKQFFDKPMEEPMHDKMVSLFSSISELPYKKSIDILKTELNTDNRMVQGFIYALKNVKRKKNRIYVDIETTTTDPELGYIIEIGILIENPQGEVIKEYNQKFDISEDKNLKYNIGIGLTDIHGINPDDLDGCPVFTDPVVQEEISSMINMPNSILVAHNDDFEIKWLNTYLNGFRETYNNINKEPINGRLDTRALSMAFLHSAPNSKLSTFTEWNGIPYENAHRAFDDAVMTRDALNNFIKRFIETGDRI